MGAKTWLLSFSNGDAKEVLSKLPKPDEGKAQQLLKMLFPETKFEKIENGDLFSTSPPDDEVYIGCYPGVSIVAASEFGIENPSSLSDKYLLNDYGSDIHLHAMHSVVDWFAFAHWENGVLQRSLSISSDDGIIEDIGSQKQFEKPYWEGKHPAVDPEDEYPLQFHPLELGEEALLEFFGYQIEGASDKILFEPEEVELLCFKRKKASVLLLASEIFSVKRWLT